MGAYFLNNRTDPGDTVHFSAVNPGDGKLSLKLISLKEGSVREIPFEEKNNVGSVCNMELNGIDPEETGYRFACGEDEFVDPYAFRVSGDETWGKYSPVGRIGQYTGPGCSGNMKRKRFSDLVLYHLHVRGFTKHKSSGVADRGTFEGLKEKIPYLKELGVDAIELMPAYDFNEIIPEEEPADQEEAIREAGISVKTGKRLNYWGFTAGNYFVPKNSFSATGDGIASFISLVEALHREGIEVFTDFYFEPDNTSRFIVDVLRHWVRSYGVDGFGLFGVSIPAAEILKDPYLSGTRFLFEKVPEGFNPSEYGNDTGARVAVLNPAFLYDNRRFLKSDADMLERFAHHLLEEPDGFSLINYMSCFNTLTLNDSVCFDRKHNEENGEGNKDGTDLNYSWNCGVEGNCRKKAVLSLRERQIKNAIAYLLISRGVPRISMGDEFRNSQKGNNNPYCLDNTVTWLNWTDLEKNSEIFEFTKELIAFRKDNPVFRHSLNRGREKYPETSFHGEMAWQAAFYNYFRHVGVMYSGKGLIYCAFNAHWQEQKLALPKPEKKEKWETVLCTFKGGEADLKEDGYLIVPPRSVLILRAK